MNWGNFNPWLFLLVLAVPVFHFYAYRKRSALLNVLADPHLQIHLIPTISTKKYRAILLGIYDTILFLLLVIVSFRPQWGFEWSERARQGVDIAIAVDVSESMLTQDVQPSRLQRAKHEVQDLLQNLRGDRVALVAFAGVAFRESPLTLDYATLKIFLSSLTPDIIPIAGSNIELAVNESIKALMQNKDQDTQSVSDPSKSRAIILITDGESFDGDLKSVRNQCKEWGINLFIMGIGTTQGGPIPAGQGFKKDKSGNLVISRLNEAELVSLADNTGGIYVQSIASGEDTDLLYNNGIKRILDDRMFNAQKARIWNEYFQIPLFVALILLAMRKFVASL